jgi:gliding motility-associated-like protein
MRIVIILSVFSIALIGQVNYSFGQVATCLSGPELITYTAAAPNELVEVTATQYLCIAGLGGINEIGVPVSTFTSTPAPDVFSGTFTEIYQPTNTLFVDPFLPEGNALVGFAVYTTSTGSFGPRLGFGTFPNLTVTKPHINSDLFLTPAARYFTIKEPDVTYVQDMLLGIARTGNMGGIPPSTAVNYFYNSTTAVGSLEMLNCACPNIYLSGLYTALQILDLGNDTTLCQEEVLILDATTPNATYLWQDNSTNPTFNVIQQGTYWVEVTVNNNSVTDTINVNFNPIPTIDLGNDTSLCQGEVLILDATTPNATYLWQDNSTNPTFNVSQQGAYWVEVAATNCSTTDTINVNFNPIPTIDLGNDTTLCQGEVLILDATTPNATYLWQSNSTNPTFNVSQQGAYWVEVAVNNCNTTDTINVNFNPRPTVDLGNDTTLCQGEVLILVATTPNATYLWQDNSTNPTFNVSQQGTYWVEVAVNNCNTRNSILIAIKDCEIILEIPNVFTPNKDGTNDLFAPIISNGIVSMRTIIYNRWGNKVYETNQLLIDWDGQGANDGTYFWIIYYTDITGAENILEGHVTILKN